MGADRHVTWEGGLLRTSPWRGDHQTAQLVATRGRPSPGAIRRCIEHLAEDGVLVAVTAALAPLEQEPYLAVGFEVHERLHLLSRDVTELPRLSGTIPMRRGRRSDHPEILAIDGRAFLPFWHLDESGLDDALSATPASRLRVALDPADESSVIGYAVTGRAGSRGYLQRLAVDPARQRQGIATALVADALRWLRRWGAREVLVNTQEQNDSALALYRSLGFTREAEGLAVLRRDLVVAGA